MAAIEILKSKIHRAKVTDANIHYEGSITIGRAHMEAAGIRAYEKVTVVDIDNGNRFETYVIQGDPVGCSICVNGAAARLVSVGDRVIIMAYRFIDESEWTPAYRPTVVFVDEDNRIR